MESKVYSIPKDIMTGSGTQVGKVYSIPLGKQVGKVKGPVQPVPPWKMDLFSFNTFRHFCYKIRNKSFVFCLRNAHSTFSHDFLCYSNLECWIIQGMDLKKKNVAGSLLLGLHSLVFLEISNSEILSPAIRSHRQMSSGFHAGQWRSEWEITPGFHLQFPADTSGADQGTAGTVDQGILLFWRCVERCGPAAWRGVGSTRGKFV